MSTIFLLTLIAAATCAPTDEFVESFVKGIEEMEKIAETYQYKQENFVPEHYNTSETSEYDFIIVGSGPSGSAIANRLSETPEWKILLLEAGYIESPVSQIPAMEKYLQHTPYDWSFRTTSQKHSCLAMEDSKCPLKKAKALGGTTATDQMIYTRGNRQDYDKWADLNLKGWCWDDLLPYFMKIEDAHIPDLDRKLHNLGGHVHLERFQHSTPLGKHVLEAGHELGIKTVDYNGKDQIGVSIPQATTKDGRRNSVAQTYLGHAIKRRNLEIRTGALATKILVSPHTKEANGVQYLQDGKLINAKATKEVIVSAGAVNTPKLLMLSGIGPKDELEALKIEPVCDLKVGHHLKDQLTFYGLNFIANSTAKHPTVRESVEELLHHHNGPLTTPGAEAVAYLKTSASKEKLDLPDVELLVTRGDRVKKETHEHDRFSIEVTLLHPKSTGKLSLHDADPLHHPLIDTNSLTDPDEEDLHSMVAGIKAALKLAETHSLQKLGVRLDHDKLPACKHIEDDEYWRCAVRHSAVNRGNVAGTARMGGEHQDKEAVVDGRLKVMGVHRLRVADASVVPVTISGNLVGPSIVVGERAAHLIKEDWK
ncbi:unnamed protein product [Phyllotreta striolata]|uniref:Glucose-methanol-choline oxidoreductase N-terminal domain-containing protein n=1 Tax=Phyllotreta striolata TaxID=444603 RepID=A0A9N9XPW7_PHYSR|nr:unnamed protein product [Phyllotreta striolata]